MYKLLLFYLLAVNILTFLLFGIDKRRAIKDKWRISEKCLLISALLGGSIGGIYGMKLFHHKTQKPAFKFGVPVFLILHIILALCIIYGRIAMA